jgi:hypothetical protein
LRRSAQAGKALTLRRGNGRHDLWGLQAFGAPQRRLDAAELVVAQTLVHEGGEGEDSWTMP